MNRVEICYYRGEHCKIEWYDPISDVYIIEAYALLEILSHYFKVIFNFIIQRGEKS